MGDIIPLMEKSMHHIIALLGTIDARYYIFK